MTKARNLHRTGRRATAAMTTAVAALGLSFMPLQHASAQTRLSADRTAWFWSSNQDFDTATTGYSAGGSLTGGVFGNGSGIASPVSPGHMAVGLKNGNSDMRSYIHFDTGAIPPGSDISSFVMTLQVSQASREHTAEHAAFSQSGRGHPPATANAGQAAILACLVTQPYGDNMSAGAGGDPPYSTEIVPANESDDKQVHVNTTKNEPSADCGQNATGTPSPDGSKWTFNITRIAKLWASGERFNEGIALLPQNISVAPTWTIEFHGPALALREKTGNDINYVTAAQAPFAVAEFAPGSSSPVTTLPIDGGFTPPPPVFSAPIDTGMPPAEVTEAPAPRVLGEQVARPAVAVGFVGTTPAWVFAILILILAGVYLVQLSIGSEVIASRYGTTVMGNRVARVLQGRRLAGGSSADAAEAIKAEEIAPHDP